MVDGWIGIIIGIIVLVGGIVAIVKGTGMRYDKGLYIGGGAAAIVVGLAIGVGSAFWLYGTEAGSRAQKSWSSETGGGLTRIVKVYNMQGQVIETYEGRFDVDANENRIIFDVPGHDVAKKRVQIWMGTGSTVTIQEK